MMKKMRNRKGLIAIMDALLAYSIAFVLIGAIVLSLSNANSDMGRRSLILAQYAEDIAEDMAQSWFSHYCLDKNCNDKNLDTDAPYRDATSSTIKNAFKNQVRQLAVKNAINIKIEIEGDILWYFDKDGDSDSSKFSKVSESASATRVLLDDGTDGVYTGSFRILTVTVGMGDKTR